MRNGGQGFSGMEMFCYLMDMPKPSTHNLKQIKTVHKVVKTLGKIIITSDAAEEEFDLHPKK